MIGYVGRSRESAHHKIKIVRPHTNTINPGESQHLANNFAARTLLCEDEVCKDVR